MKEEILNLAKKILNNTDLIYKAELEGFIEDYKNLGENTCYKGMLKVITQILEDGYDVEGFGLYEIPEPHIYIFFNEATEEMFDVTLWNGNAAIAYMDDDHMERKAKNISHAINHYSKEFA
jgi:hypothetical protein